MHSSSPFTPRRSIDARVSPLEEVNPLGLNDNTGRNLSSPRINKLARSTPSAGPRAHYSNPGPRDRCAARRELSASFREDTSYSRSNASSPMTPNPCTVRNCSRKNNGTGMQGHLPSVHNNYSRAPIPLMPCGGLRQSKTHTLPLGDVLRWDSLVRQLPEEQGGRTFRWGPNTRFSPIRPGTVGTVL